MLRSTGLDSTESFECRVISSSIRERSGPYALSDPDVCTFGGALVFPRDRTYCDEIPPDVDPYACAIRSTLETLMWCRANTRSLHRSYEQLTECQQRYTDLEATTSSLQAQYGTLQHERDQLAEQLSSMTLERDRYQQERDQYLQDRDQLTTQLNTLRSESSDRIQELDAQLASASISLEGFRVTAETQSSEATRLRRQRDILRGRLEDAGNRGVQRYRASSSFGDELLRQGSHFFQQAWNYAVSQAHQQHGVELSWPEGADPSDLISLASSDDDDAGDEAESDYNTDVSSGSAT